jgi:hypothetical protein
MPTSIVNPPVKTTSKGGYAVALLEIDTDPPDHLLGMIDTPGMGNIRGAWDESGILRNGTDAGNIDPSRPEIAQLIARAKARQP